MRPGFLLAIGAVAVLHAANASAALTDGWSVLLTGPPNSPNLLANPGFETGPPTSADGWSPYYQGYAVDTAIVHGGRRSIRLANTATADVRGALQPVTLNQTVPRPLFFSGWSRASGVTGSPGENYSIYLDVYYNDGTPLYGQVLTFSTGTHDWQYREGCIFPEKPVRSVYIYLLLRNEYVGTVWFDDVAMHEFSDDTKLFDGVAVREAAAPAGLDGEPVLSIATGDGLSVGLTRAGGAVAALSLDGTALVPAGRAFTGGLIVRDVFARSDFVHLGGTVSQNGGTLAQSGRARALDLRFDATWRAGPGSIEIEGTLTDTTGNDRALAVYCALPLDAAGWQWGDDLRRSRTIGGSAEYRNTTSNGYDDTGPFGRYPWTSVTGLVTATGTASGLSLAYPLDSPRRVRLVENPATRQLYAAFDLGLTDAASQIPRKATFRVVFYRHEATWPFTSAESVGFRAAAQRFYELFPAVFAKRTPSGGEGIWLAFTNLATIPGLSDFGIAYHEAGLSEVPFDDSVGISTFRYVTEPWSYWMPIRDPSVDNTDYDQVMAYLQRVYQYGSGREQQMAEATLSSGSFDENGRYRYFATAAPWCNDGGNCAAFVLNPDPDVSVPPYTVNKAQTDWNPAVWGAYETTPTLDGEYVDGMLCYPALANFRREHFPAANLPPTFDVTTGLLQTPELFSTYEYLLWLTSDVHARGKLTMANGMLLGLPWGVDLFDFGGAEVYWWSNGSFVAPPDRDLSFKRALSYRKPFGTLLNMNFDELTFDRTERYMRINLFYGIYPNLFNDSENAIVYWEQPSLYERDRPLFKKYVPLIRELSGAGWEPIPHGRSSEPSVYLERWGAGPTLRLTLRNDGTVPRTSTLTLDAAGTGLPVSGSRVVRDRVGGKSLRVNWTAGTLVFDWDLAADAVALLQFGDAPPPVPDGRIVPGAPLRVSRAAGGDVTITWDAVTCRPPGNHLVWYDLAALASYAIREVTCGIGVEGSWTGTPPSGDVAVLVVSDDGASVEGSYGPDGQGIERPSSTTACGLAAKRIAATCP